MIAPDLAQALAGEVRDGQQEKGDRDRHAVGNEIGSLQRDIEQVFVHGRFKQRQGEHKCGKELPSDRQAV